VVHWRAHTERIVIQFTAAGEYIALSRGNTSAKFVSRDILVFYGNGKSHYYLFTDNQAAEHIATQLNMNEHSRSIDIRHHSIRQDYIDGKMRIGGVGTQDNTSEILTKYLQPPLHIKHTTELNITHTKPTLINCVTKLTLNFERASDDPDTSRNHHLPQNQQLPLSSFLETDRPPITAAHTDAHPHTCRKRPTAYRSQPPKERIDKGHRGAKRHRQKHQPSTLQELSKHVDLFRRGHEAGHDRPKHERKEINPNTYEMPPAFLDLIFPQHPQPTGHRSQPAPPRRCDKITHTIKTKTHKKHRKRKSEALQIRLRTGQTTQTNPKPSRTSIYPPRWQLKRTHTNNNITLTAPPLGLSQPTYQHKCERQKGAVKTGQNKNRPKIQNTVLNNTQARIIQNEKGKSFCRKIGFYSKNLKKVILYRSVKMIFCVLRLTNAYDWF
jgi:hypothetical protein